MKRPVLACALLVSVGAAGFLIGWLAPGGAVEPVTVARHPGRSVAAPLPQPNDETASALLDLDEALSGPAPARAAFAGDPDLARPPPRRRVEPVPPVPAPDVAVLFRREVSAVVGRPGADLGVLLVDSSGETRQTRVLRVGDAFMGGWKLAALTPSEAVLRDGEQERRVALFAPMGGAGGA